MIKFLVRIDTAISFKDDYRKQVELALHQQQDTYRLNGVNIEYEIIPQYLSNAPWLTNIVSYSWMNVETLKLKQSGYKAYSVVYIFAEENWKAEGIGGWHVGNYNGYQVQLIKGFKNNLLWLTRTLLMESMHSWDTPILNAGINLSEYLGVNDYDETLVHGMYWQGTTLSQQESVRIFGKEYERYDYSLLIKKLSPLLAKIFPMYKHIIFGGTEQYIRGQDGKDYHIYNLAILDALKKMGILSTADPEIVTSINDSGIEIVCLTKE